MELNPVSSSSSCLSLSFLVCEVGRILGRCHFNWRDGVWVLGSRGWPIEQGRTMRWQT